MGSFALSYGRGKVSGGSLRGCGFARDQPAAVSPLLSGPLKYPPPV